MKRSAQPRMIREMLPPCLIDSSMFDLAKFEAPCTVGSNVGHYRAAVVGEKDNCRLSLPPEQD